MRISRACVCPGCTAVIITEPRALEEEPQSCWLLETGSPPVTGVCRPGKAACWNREAAGSALFPSNVGHSPPSSLAAPCSLHVPILQQGGQGPETPDVSCPGSLSVQGED